MALLLRHAFGELVLRPSGWQARSLKRPSTSSTTQSIVGAAVLLGLRAPDPQNVTQLAWGR